MIVRVRYSKLGKIRFLGHRDVARVFERALRAAGLPVAYSEGFSPRPKVAFGLALSVGYESDSEYLDVVMAEPVELVAAAIALADALPPGLELIELGEVDRSTPSLMEAVTSCTWTIVLSTDDIDAVRASADRLLAADTVIIVRERKGKTIEDDIRPDILALTVQMHEATSNASLTAELGTDRRSLRPAEFLAALGSEYQAMAVRRNHQWISHGDDRQQPHEAAVARAAHTRCVP